MTATRAFQNAFITFVSVIVGLIAARAQDPRLAEHPAQVTWVATLKPIDTIAEKRFADARTIPLEVPGPTSTVKVSFTCDCNEKTSAIHVTAPDARKIQSVVLRQMRFPGDTEGPVLMDVMKAKHALSANTLDAQIPIDQFGRVSNVILNQQCMAIVMVAGSPTTLAGPILMYKAAMR